MAVKSADGAAHPAGLARRHFLAITAAGAGRLTAVAVPAAVLASKKAEALGLFPRDDPHGPEHHCFARGTLVQTPDGEVLIESLAVGDLIVTTNGAMPVRWVGRRTLEKNESASWHPSVLPVRVARSAIDDQTPSRDLYLSQTHSLLIDGALIPVKHLVNESSITIDHSADALDLLEYFCIKLDTHEVMFVEGLAAETFQHRGGHIFWDNLNEYEALYGRDHEVMPPFAPHCRYAGGRAELGALLRLAASRFVDLRDPIQIAYARIAGRVDLLAA